MTLLPLLLTLALAISLTLNAYAFLKSRIKPAKPESYDARALLHDLTAAGVALIKIERIAPNEIFLRSPRDAG